MAKHSKMNGKKMHKLEHGRGRSPKTARAVAKRETKKKTSHGKANAQQQPRAVPLTPRSIMEGVVRMGQVIDRYFEGVIKTDLPASALAQHYADMRLLVDIVEIATEPLKKLHEKFKTETIPEAFERERIKSFTLDNGARIGTSVSLFASIKGENRDAALEWLRKNELGDIIIETVNSSTLSATAKKLMETGKELPEDTFTVHYKNNTSYTAPPKARGRETPLQTM